MTANENYNAYLNSPWWQSRRAAFLNSRPCVCELCGSTEDIQVHHLTYANIGKEPDEDLMMLCSKCHLENVQDNQDNLRIARRLLRKKFEMSVRSLADKYKDADARIVAQYLYRIVGHRKMSNLPRFAGRIQQHTRPDSQLSTACSGDYTHYLSCFRNPNTTKPISGKVRKEDLEDQARAIIYKHCTVSYEGNITFSALSEQETDWFVREIYSYYKEPDNIFFVPATREDVIELRPALDKHNTIALHVKTHSGYEGPWSWMKALAMRTVSTITKDSLTI